MPSAFPSTVAPGVDAGAAPVEAASKQRLAAARALAAHWGDERAATALLGATDLHVLPRNGQSASLLFTQTGGHGWIAKLSFESDDPVDDRAAVEEFVSRHLVAFAEDVPFVMHCVASHTLRDVLPSLGGGLRAAFGRMALGEQEGVHSHPTGYLVMSERGTGVTFTDYLEWVMRPTGRMGSQRAPPTVQDLEAVSLQVVYCVAGGERRGVAHNDLHLGNILIEYLATEVQFTLCDRPAAGAQARARAAPGMTPVGFELHLPPTRWMCKIIDWDMATINGVATMPPHVHAPKNGALDLFFPPDACEHAGLCGQPGRDLAMVAYNVWQELEGIERGARGAPRRRAAAAKGWWLKLVPQLEPFLRAAPDSLVHAGYPCYASPGGCRPVPTPSAVSVLRGHTAPTPPAQWWRPGPVAVHRCTLPLHTLASQLSVAPPGRSDRAPTGPHADAPLRGPSNHRPRTRSQSGALARGPAAGSKP
jgi:hypothetical protein